eukprot:gene13199-9045_t
MLLIVNIVDEWESQLFCSNSFGLLWVFNKFSFILIAKAVAMRGWWLAVERLFEIAFGTLYIFGSRWFCLLVWVGCLCDLDPLIRDLLRANTLVVIQGSRMSSHDFVMLFGCDWWLLTLWICDVGALTSDFTSSLCYVVWIKCGFYLVAMAYGAFCVFYRTVGIYGVFIYMLFVLVDLLDGIA